VYTGFRYASPLLCHWHPRPGIRLTKFAVCKHLYCCIRSDNPARPHKHSLSRLRKSNGRIDCPLQESLEHHPGSTWVCLNHRSSGHIYHWCCRFSCQARPVWHHRRHPIPFVSGSVHRMRSRREIRRVFPEVLHWHPDVGHRDFGPPHPARLQTHRRFRRWK